MRIEEYVAPDLLEKFEFYNYNHALEIITQAFPEEWGQIEECLRRLSITTDDLREAGGNETNIPKKFDDVLWRLTPAACSLCSAGSGSASVFDLSTPCLIRRSNGLELGKMCFTDPTAKTTLL